MTTNLQTQIVNSVEEQLRELQPGLEKQVEIAVILADLRRLQSVLIPINDNSVNLLLEGGQKGIIDEVTKIQAGAEELAEFGKVLVDLYSLQQILEGKIQGWIDGKLATITDRDQLQNMLRAIIISVRQLLNYRPDVGAIMDDLTAIKNLRG